MYGEVVRNLKVALEASGNDGRKVQWFLDWALIGLNDPCLTNRIDFPTPEDEKRSLENDYPAPTWQTIDLGSQQKVAFRGRISGWVFGVTNPAVSVIHPISGDKAISGDYIGTHLSTPYATLTFFNEQEDMPVVQRGDSGAVLVLNRKGSPSCGSWVGLVYGFDAIGVGYYTPIAAVFGNIEQVTGGKVVHPTRVADSL